MTLTQEQANEVKEWLQGGAGIGDVQKRLSEKFGINGRQVSHRRPKLGGG